MKRKLLLCLSLLLLTGCAGEASMTLTQKKTQNANGKCTPYSELERKILRFSGERANQAGNLPNMEPDKGWSMGANRHI